MLFMIRLLITKCVRVSIGGTKVYDLSLCVYVCGRLLFCRPKAPPSNPVRCWQTQFCEMTKMLGLFCTGNYASDITDGQALHIRYGVNTIGHLCAGRWVWRLLLVVGETAAMYVCTTATSTALAMR